MAVARCRDDPDVFESFVVKIGDVVTRVRRDVCQHARAKGKVRPAFDLRAAFSLENHESFFVMAGGMPADALSFFEADETAPHSCRLRSSMKERAIASVALQSKSERESRGRLLRHRAVSKRER